MTLTYDRDREAFFEECRERGRLPKNDALKLIVLERLLEPLEVGETYMKAELNERVEPHFDDHALVRRELVNFGYCRYDNRTNEYTVEKTTFDEDDLGEISRLERHARDVGLVE
jgi:hypothetical protein